jgi:hypothetical protein
MEASRVYAGVGGTKRRIIGGKRFGVIVADVVQAAQEG